MMRFLAKVAVQRLLAALPGGERLYSLAQNHATRSALPDPGTLTDKASLARLYAEMARTHGNDLNDCSPHLDIGAGWHPIIPLVLRELGVTEHLLVDIRPLLRPADLASVMRGLGMAVPDNLSPEAPLERLGMRYHAPALPPYPVADGSMGLVTCSRVLNYPPPAAVRAIHTEAARVLKPGGLYAAAVGLVDYYAASDPSLPKFNFLRYSHATWKRVYDNPFTPMNRLRAADHRRLLDGLPFDVLEWRIEGGGPEDMMELERSRPHAEWRRLPDEDLARTGVVWLLRRR
jgi:hypothetical protein